MPLTRRSVGKGVKSTTPAGDNESTSAAKMAEPGTEQNVKEEETGVVIELKLSEADKPEETDDRERENEDDILFGDIIEGDGDVDNDIQLEEVDAEEVKADFKTDDLVTNVEDKDVNKMEKGEDIVTKITETKVETEEQGTGAEENLPLIAVEDVSETTQITDTTEEKDDDAKKNEDLVTVDDSTKPMGDSSTSKAEDEKVAVKHEENSEPQKETAELSKESAELSQESDEQTKECGDQQEESAEQHDDEVKEVGEELDDLNDLDKIDIAEKFKNPPFPKSLEKLQKLTVTIGPIQQVDLLSSELHEILKMITDFEIKFEGKEKTNNKGTKSQIMKMGFVKTQFKIQKPAYLVKMARLLGSLNIRGRDMSVKFPEVFNRAVEDCKEYLQENRETINKNERDKHNYMVALRKRRLVVKNIPENTTEDTMKALFPECLTVSFREESVNNKKICSALLTFENEKTCKECFENNKDVEIGDSKVAMKLLYTLKRGNTRGRRRWSQIGTGRGSGSAGRGRLNRGSVRGGKTAGMGGGASGAPSTSGKQSMASNMSPHDKRPERWRNSGSKEGQASNRNLAKKAGNLGNKPGQLQTTQEKNRRRRQRQRTNREMIDQDILARNMNQMSLANMQVGNMMGQAQGVNFQAQGSRNTGSNEDPMAMMMYLKDTIAKMEEKISQRSNEGARNYSGEGSSPRRGRKRQGGMINNNKNAKRNRGDNLNMRNQSMQQDIYLDDSNYYGNNYRRGDFGGDNSYGRNDYYGRDDYGRRSLFGDEGRNRYGGNAGFSNNLGMDYGGYRNQGNRSNYNMPSGSGRFGGGMW